MHSGISGTPSGDMARRSGGVRIRALALLLLTLLVTLAACSLTLGPRDTTYPLKWQPAVMLPPHTASFVFTQSARNVGYACTIVTGAATTGPTPSPTSRSTPHATPSSQPLSRFVYDTSDGGASWQSLATPFPEGRACRVFAAALNPDELFVAQPATPNDDTGLLPLLWRSRDGGKTWHALGQITQSGEQFSFANVAVVEQRLVAQVTSIGVPRLPDQLYASADDGKTWQLIAKQFNLLGFYAAGSMLYVEASESLQPAASTQPVSVPALAVAVPSSGNPPPTVLYRSADAGLTWAKLTTPFADVTGLHVLLAADGSRQYAVGLIPAATAYGADAHAVIVSLDGGATWTKVDAPPTIGTPSADLLPDGTILVQSLLQDTQPAGGPTGEIFRTRLGQNTWQLLGIGPYVTSWQVARTSSSSAATTRLWGSAWESVSGRSPPVTYVYADVP